MSNITLNSDNRMTVNPYNGGSQHYSLPGRTVSNAETEMQYLRTGEGIPGVDFDESMMVTPNFGDQGASTTLSAISRAEWEDFKKNYLPELQNLLSSYGSKGIDQETSRNLKAVGESYNNAARTADDMRKLYNTNMTRRQFDKYQRDIRMNKNTAQVHASNMTRLARKDRNQALMAGTTSNLTNKMESARS